MPRLFSPNQAGDIIPAPRRPDDSTQWDDDESQAWLQFQRSQAIYWARYRQPDADVGAQYEYEQFPRRAEPFPPVFATPAPWDVPPGSPYYRNRPPESRPLIGSDSGMNHVYEMAAVWARQLERDYQLRFVRMLGWGGLGAVALFDTRFKPDPNRDATTYSFYAIKFSQDRSPEANRLFRREKKYMARYKRALHIAQIIERPADRAMARATLGMSAKLIQQLEEKFLPNKKKLPRRSMRIMDRNPAPEPDEIEPEGAAQRIMMGFRAKRKDIPPTGPDGRDRNFDDEDAQDLMMMEYYPLGPLDQAIRDNGERGFPKRVLWHLFDCMIKGLIGLEYPPLKQKFTDYKDDYGPPISETIPAAKSRVATNLVHFDIDPQNIFIGEYGEGPDHDHHDYVPPLKIADMGLAIDFVPQYLRNRELIWTKRDSGKHAHFPPESFHEEWEWVRSRPLAHPELRVAGKYSWKTNLYQIGIASSLSLSLSLD
ncbi:hypothetical protein QBC39DRAFT_30588 [Podospora conica]|nr:hypothetical protein QBC39DRAFT_30588 [Schizothecium conicum]